MTRKSTALSIQETDFLTLRKYAEENAMTFSGFAALAMKEKIKRDNLIRARTNREDSLESI